MRPSPVSWPQPPPGNGPRKGPRTSRLSLRGLSFPIWNVGVEPLSSPWGSHWDTACRAWRTVEVGSPALPASGMLKGTDPL